MGKSVSLGTIDLLIMTGDEVRELRNDFIRRYGIDLDNLSEIGDYVNAVVRVVNGDYESGERLHAHICLLLELYKD